MKDERPVNKIKLRLLLKKHFMKFDQSLKSQPILPQPRMVREMKSKEENITSPYISCPERHNDVVKPTTKTGSSTSHDSTIVDEAT